MLTPHRAATRRTTAVLAAAAITGLTLAGCSASGESSDKVVITLAGPNQWNSQSDSFGQEWEDLIAAFEEAETGIEVKTTVLPLASFADTLTTQLAAGTAPELIFNQPQPAPDQVVALDDYLAEPNPYNADADSWLDEFNPNAYGDAQRDAKGQLYWVPFNLVIAGLFYNQEALDDAGVEAPIASIGDLIDACSALKDAGYTPLAMDNGSLGTGWTSETLLSSLLNKYGAEWNVFDAAGEPGTATSVTNKSLVKAILTGELDATKTPEVREAVSLLKEIFDNCATENWSGVAASGQFVGGQEFLAGDAAMAWGTNFAISNLADVDWEWSSMPFPSVTKTDTPLSDGSEARFGAVAGGTSYMIPATTKGEKLEAAVKFLQFASSPATNGDWVAATDTIPATSDASTASEGVGGLVTGEWAKPRLISIGSNSPKADSGSNLWEGYLLGTRTLDEQLAYIQTGWVGWAEEAVAEAGITEDWATQ
ncbi:ABC transporter substrate-binding protein [Microbacterium allomyrinae]|uniref:Extracellular solute-binding protein n=1 Tax=Microbacterium allomyrinae TaxID=2830666 RepID=A0A9X1LT60_9MICO|nr:extracellular solute-binding protein [Microbacterium allomyrinae]MCC2031510.1 extracellular solute-binding protein [Microbacterium allomyrinae]